MPPTAKFKLGYPVHFLYEPSKVFVIVRRDYRPHSGNWHYLLRGDKWRLEDDLSLALGKGEAKCKSKN